MQQQNPSSYRNDVNQQITQCYIVIDIFSLVGVVFLCFILSISTAFEYKLVQETKYYNKSFPIMSAEALCPTSISDAFANNESVTSTLKSFSGENIDEILAGSGTTESDFMEELIDGENAFYEYNGDDRISKRNVKLWEINGIFYNKSEIQSMCEPVSVTNN